MNELTRIAFVVEQSLGHVTHAANLRAVVERDETVRARWCPIPYETVGLASRVPVFNSNWTVRAGIRARREIGAAARGGGVDALFVHTQVPAVLSADWLRKIPSVVSVDATPLQYDQLGAFYDHSPGWPPAERLKFLANRRCFKNASAVVAWSEWAKTSLVDDYAVAPDKVKVIRPGVAYDTWSRVVRDGSSDGPVGILFVGADFARKGGPTLLSAFRLLRAHCAAQSGLELAAELHIVTKTPVATEPGVHVYSNMTPNAPALLELYQRCDVFCLPTHADTLGLALCEAGAAGLPLVSTSVGAIPELIEDSETGLLVPPGDAGSLAAALIRLVEEPELRRRLGSAAAAAVAARFDAATNAGHLVALLKDVAHRNL